MATSQQLSRPLPLQLPNMNTLLKPDTYTGLLSKAAVSPTSFITQNGQWTSTSYMYLIVYIVIFIICFILSLGSYKEDDPTPYGHRLLYAISAGAWNILYLVYFALLR